MLTNNFDSVHNGVTEEKTVLPEQVSSVSFAYDRGRICIQVNGETLYEDNSGMSDFLINLDRRT